MAVQHGELFGRGPAFPVDGTGSFEDNKKYNDSEHPCNPARYIKVKLSAKSNRGFICDCI